MHIILSSNNPKKIQELQAILEGMEVKSYRAYLKSVEIEENGVSFEQNARLKAQRIYQLLDMQGDFCVLADDSGLCVSALKGMPGIHSARFASIQEGTRDIAQGRFQTPQTSCNDTQNNLKLLVCYHTQEKSDPNASLYDIKEFFSGRDAKGKLNPASKAKDAHYKMLYAQLKEVLGALAQALQPKVYQYGFLR
ncbi:non-canonical purine NTP pyrophosphatase [Helicobacter heilmannii]|uniref:non-canonical purine NTP pyrophosphatase n=1 Tax=Helicobacter heilmannii TaxID=35817 RepID=UPI00028A91C8|nr:non-canonical purine NTP pyrophosphatase [Helicobacter heilmannii]CCM73698.1 Nucleoside 5-triphosphatase RdgB (dHAPTP,dITP,XTP-specific) [Helicobacter heilmannii ASB1.4]